MSYLMAYSRQFAECNDSFYKTRDMLKRIYGIEYIKQLEKIGANFQADFYELHMMLLSSVGLQHPDKSTQEKIENLLLQYKMVITKLTNIYIFYINNQLRAKSK